MRQCDGCQVCCVFDPVVPLGKPARTPCQHQCAAGCGIYPTRPECCATYKCSWLAGQLPEWAKPNLCGIILETMFLPLLPPRKPLVILMGEAMDVPLAMTFESRWEELVTCGADIVVIAGLDETKWDRGLLYIARNVEAAKIYAAWVNKVQQDGGAEFHYADGETRRINAGGNQ